MVINYGGKWAKSIVFTASLVPFAWLAYAVLTNRAGANPVEFATHGTGEWALRFLLFSLAITPLRKLISLPDLIKFRKMLGLYAFFYATVHFLIWLILDKSFDLAGMLADTVKRPFITAGMAALVVMIPLAITSTTGWIRRLGKRWRILHRLVYFSAVAAVVHFYWLVKSDVREPLFYAALLGVLFLFRLPYMANLRLIR